MKHRLLAALAPGLILAACASPPDAGPLAGEEATAAVPAQSDHAALALADESEASAAQGRADEHRRMLDDGYRAAYGSPFAGLWPGNGGFIRHCENLIRAYSQAAEDKRASAKLHRELASRVKE